MAERISRRFAPRRWPVRWRLAGVSAGLTLVILVCFAMVVGRLVQNRLEADHHQEIVSIANRAAAKLNLNDTVAVARMITDGELRLVDSFGNPVGSEPASHPSFGPPSPDQITQVGGYDVASQQVLTFTDSLEGPLFVQYGETRSSLDASIDRVWLLLAAGVLGGTIFAALAGIAVAGRAMRPISSLTAAAREIATTRDPSLRLPKPETEDEVGELGETLDQMLRELDAARGETQQMIQAQREFVADASHELRTPLTSILANLELLQARLKERGEAGEEAEIVEGALGSSRRMRRLVADLLLLARADAGRSGPRRDCDLAEIAAGALAEVAPVAGDHELRLDSDGPVPVECNPDDLHRLALNLLENAVRHTPAGTTVDAAVYARNGDGVLEVSDDGPGIPADAGEQLFERFVSGGGPADLSADSGTGLGLAIVKAVASSHGGEVEVGRSPSGGATFIVRIPLGPKQVQVGEPAPAA